MSLENEIGILGTKIGHIDEAVSNMNKNVNTILEKLDQQNGDLIRAKKDIDYLKEELTKTKNENETSKDNIWEEFRRRSKMTMWIVGTSISASFLAMAVLKYFG